MTILATPVPAWIILVAFTVGMILAAAIGRKFGNAWVAIVGQLLTVKDVRVLADFVWQANILPKWLTTARFQGDKEKFINYMTSLILKLLPEIGRLDEVALNMTQGGLRSVGTQIELEGRQKYRFRPPDMLLTRGDFDVVKG